MMGNDCGLAQSMTLVKGTVSSCSPCTTKERSCNSAGTGATLKRDTAVPTNTNFSSGLLAPMACTT